MSLLAAIVALTHAAPCELTVLPDASRPEAGVVLASKLRVLVALATAPAQASLR